VAEPEEPVSIGRRSAPPADAPRDGDGWRRLFGRNGVQEALEEIARTIDVRGGGLELVLEGASAIPRRASVRRNARDAGASESFEHVVAVLGHPEWRLRARGQDSLEHSKEAAVRAALALEAWRAAREGAARSEALLSARTLELDLIQDLGRAAAEARTLEGLFRGVCHALHRGGDDDAIAVAHGIGPRPEALVYLLRPLEPGAVQELVRHAGGVLGWEAETEPRVRVERLDLFDGRRGTRGAAGASDVIVLPLLRRGSTVASLAILPSRPTGEDRLRLLFGAANQMAVHLDRILTVKEAEEGRFRAVIDAMPQAIFVTDGELRIVGSNPSARRFLDEHGAIATPITRLGSLDVLELKRSLASTGASAAGEARLEGGAIVEVTLSAFEDSVHGRGGFVLVLSDVTEQRRLHERLAQSEKLSSLGELISGIAHELNNPLASVLGYAQLVRDSVEDERLSRRLARIDEEARRCRKIVHNLLSFARRHEPERRPLSLNETVESVATLLAYQLRVGGIEPRFDLDAKLPAIHGDPHQLQQALLNLVTNALHALATTDRGGRLVLRTRGFEDGHVVVEVEDDGPGIPEEIRSRVFDPFFTTKAAGKGTGLGLSIAYGIVTAHGGSIEVEHGEPAGTRFRITLPVGTPSGAAAAAQPAAVARETLDGPAGKILVVDDEEALARLVAEALDEDGHSTVPVLGRAEALERLEREHFDLVICDLKMPGPAVERLRDEMERLRPGMGRRLLLITGDTLSAEPEDLARREGFPLLHKPFDLEDLRRAVRGQLGRGRGPCGT